MIVVQKKAVLTLAEKTVANNVIVKIDKYGKY
jgi:hypothetical protein